ncbi:MAG: arginine--tRNA ligase [Bacilli bacterium]|nr:arginine--tRNA ligase [Bacilli bacterium]
MINEILLKIKNKLNNIIEEKGISEEIILEIPKEESNGDYATNLALKLAKSLKKPPMAIAQEMVKEFDLKDLHLDKIEIANPGFINFFLDKKYLTNIIFKIINLKDDYGKLKIGANKKVNIEFVSANPTGYLHIGHGRGAAYGDSLSRIFKKVGYEVTKEHYVNDAGNQIKNLAISIYERYRELFGYVPKLGDDSYYGQEIIEIAKMIKKEKNDVFLENEWYDFFRNYGTKFLLEGLKKDLKSFNVEFDIWFSEQSLYDNGEVEAAYKKISELGHTYEEGGATWLKTQAFGDEKDRVLIKNDKTLTYLMPDIAYHYNKISRGYDYLIDVLGADHHGYINRLKASIAMLGKDPNMLDVDILQMVRVIQNNEEIKMSKRSGKAITLHDLIEEVGTDALRFLYSSKALNTHMDLDLDLALKNSNENPVYYVQYAYARICSLFKVAENRGIIYTGVSEFADIDIKNIEKIVKVLIQYPNYIEEAAIKRKPHKLIQYALELATCVHAYYNDEKIITEDEEMTIEKMTVFEAVKIVLKDCLSLVGVGVKEKM